MTQREHVEKSQWMEDSFVAEIFFNFTLQRLDVCKDVSMGDHHAARLGSCTGGEDNLQDILPRELRGRVGCIGMPGDCFRDGIDRQGRNGQTWRGNLLRVNEQLCVDLLRHARGEFSGRDLVDRDYHRAAQDASPEHNRPFRRILRPEQNRIALADSMGFKFSRESSRFEGDVAIGQSLNAVSAVADEGDIAALAGIFREELEQRLARHRDNVSYFKTRMARLLRCSNIARRTAACCEKRSRGGNYKSLLARAVRLATYLEYLSSSCTN